MFYSNINLNTISLVFSGKNFVDDSYIDKVDSYIKKQQLVKAQFRHSGDDKDLDAIRSSKIHWMTDEKYSDKLAPIYQELTSKILFINEKEWKWIIDGWEPFQYTEYDESYKGHYEWHIDYGMKSPQQPLSRKLSFSLGISDKDDYEGGELLTKINAKESSIKLDRGEIVIFPSWMLHKVTPVTKGRRKVIVGWGMGPVV